MKTIQDLQAEYRKRLNALETEISALTLHIRQAHPSEEREMDLEERHGLRAKAQLLIQVIHDLDDIN